MTVGLNLLGTLWDYNYPDDDETGGSVPSGTVIQERISLRISARKPVEALLQQGVEAVELYFAVIGNQTLNIRHHNEIEITAPSNSTYYGEFFRVVGSPRRSSTHPSDSRSYLLVDLKRVERSRTIQ